MSRQESWGRLSPKSAHSRRRGPARARVTVSDEAAGHRGLGPQNPKPLCPAPPRNQPANAGTRTQLRLQLLLQPHPRHRAPQCAAIADASPRATRGSSWGCRRGVETELTRKEGQGMRRPPHRASGLVGQMPRAGSDWTSSSPWDARPGSGTPPVVWYRKVPTCATATCRLTYCRIGASFRCPGTRRADFERARHSGCRLRSSRRPRPR